MDTDDLELEKLRLKRRKQLVVQQVRETSSNDTEVMLKKNFAISASNEVVHLNSNNFSDYIKNSDLPILIDYWAEWCQPCKQVAPIIEALERRYRGKMNIAKLNIDHNPQVANEFGISSIPTFHIWYNNKIIDQFTGALPGEKFDQKVKGIIDKLN
ncbi:MAG: thioredoxin [Candidatus Hodarchaeales archaeon]|jgi:thioredoxin 1